MNFSTDQLVTCLEALSAAPIRYRMHGLEGKVHNLGGTDAANIRWLDCSGYTQYVIYRNTTDHLRVPGGSRSLRDWLRRNNYSEVDYATEAPRHDDVMRLGYREAVWDAAREHREHAGHVWFVINGQTHECTTRGRFDGPASFSWEVRREEVDEFYVLGQAPGFMLRRIFSRVHSLLHVPMF